MNTQVPHALSQSSFNAVSFGTKTCLNSQLPESYIEYGMLIHVTNCISFPIFNLNMSFQNSVPQELTSVTHRHKITIQREAAVKNSCLKSQLPESYIEYAMPTDGINWILLQIFNLNM
jgi:hypothetical protein